MKRETVIEMILDPASRPAPGTPEHSAFLAAIESSEELRTMYEQQEAVWNALDSWEAVEPSAGFDRAVFEKIQPSPARESWWSGWFAAWRPSFAAGLASLLLIAGVVVYQAKKPPVESASSVQKTEAVAAADSDFVEQVDQSLDDLEMLADFEGLDLASQVPDKS